MNLSLKKRSLYLLLLVITITTNSLYAQKSKIDSLLIQYKREKIDTNRIKRLYDLSWEYQRQGFYDSALKYADIGITLAEQLKEEQKAARFYNAIGVVYKNRGVYSKALENYFTGLKIAEKYKDTLQITSLLSNVGSLYLFQGKYTEAESNLSQALRMSEKIGNQKRISHILLTFASLYTEQKNYPLALEYQRKAYQKYRSLGNKDYEVVCLENIGVIYHEQKIYDTAFKYYSEALELAKKYSFKKQMGDLYGNIAQIYVCFNEDTKAEEYFLKAIKLSDSIGTTVTQEANLIGLSNVYSRMGKTPEAYHFYRKAIELRDSLYSHKRIEESTRQEMNYQFEKKEQAIKIENEQRIYRERLISWSIGVGLFIVIIFSAFILRSLSITKKQKQIIEDQKRETDLQKKIIEEKNKDIMDSIHYAKRIQKALLREEEHVSSHLPEHFILFLPKDIVSGDFYWALEKQEYWYFAVADCTGHGVPGAIMSMLGISFLNDIVLSGTQQSPADILNRLRDRVVFELRQTDESVGNKDGMDISLCRLNLKTLELEWAGANNSLNLIRNGKFEEIKADKQPIGYHPSVRPFTNFKTQLQKGDSIYIYSDGFADQFGGPKGKKLTYKRLEATLSENYNQPLKDQKLALNKLFAEWKGAQEQVDDVCIVGIRV